MARILGKLSAQFVGRVNAPGMYGDGGGLWLQVGPAGAKSWLFRYRHAGRARYMGLGPTHTIGLADARNRARGARQLLLDGVDPLDHRRSERAAALAAAADMVLFREAAERYIAANEPAWRNAAHRKQWRSTVATYCNPVIGEIDVRVVALRHVLSILEPIWSTKPETASRVRGRIETVLDWAKARGMRSGENPARWRGHLDKLLPKPTKVRRPEHHAALPYDDLPAFMGQLRRQPGTAARALEFTILTAARTGEALGATWSEIDLQAGLWTVPASRMKAGREHRVPLAAAAVDLLQALPRHGDLVFEGAKAGRPMSPMAMLMLLRRMERPDLTTHGFRSTFRDWSAERTAFPPEVAEMALAHTISDAVERAYRRGDLMEKRRALADTWARFALSPPRAADVVPLRGAR